MEIWRIVDLSQYVNSKKHGKTQFLDRKPGFFEVAVQDNPNKGKHGIGAILKKRIDRSTSKNSNGSVTNTLTQTSTIYIKNNIFGAEFAAIYGTDESRRRALAQTGLDALSLYASEGISVPARAAWVYIAQTKYLPRVFLALQLYVSRTSKYKCGYEAGGKIEEKLVISTTVNKDGHGIEKIKRTYTVWGHTSKVGICDCLENKESIF
jgi:hypothetical protein